MEETQNNSTMNHSDDNNSNSSNSSNNNRRHRKRDPNKPSFAMISWFAEKPGQQPFCGLAGVTLVKNNSSHMMVSPLDEDLGFGPTSDSAKNDGGEK
ncbi:uncharacterized protein B0H64DRAFT_409106 [Chaetomium fimeti]|uniref:Uncharacterized protein n=1 Tax=Chaetomium fimeti TaxID=1854472 RepID=A0AAE0H7R2_9PEZI|nr:hypothetical protein B0H64DRAFT_409106 [Chaetomium fimeti]